MTGIRIRQLVVPSGVGAIVNDTTARSLLVRSLDSWFGRPDSDAAEFNISDPRLQDLLGGVCLRSPPEWRTPAFASVGATTNIQISIPAFRFPTWWTCRASSCHWMTQWPRGMAKAPVCEMLNCKLYRKPMVQIPLVLGCELGCLSDVPWRELTGCGPDCRTIFLKGSGGIPERKLVCDTHCPEGVSLGKITQYSPSGFEELFRRRNGADFACPGVWAWQGRDPKPCTGRPVVSFVNALSLHTTLTISSIYIPNEIIAVAGSECSALRAFLLSDAVNYAWQELQEFIARGGRAHPKAIRLIQEIKNELGNGPEALRPLAEQRSDELIEKLTGAASDRISRTMPRHAHGIAAKYRAEEHCVLHASNSMPDFVTEPLGNLQGEMQDYFGEVVRVRRIRQTLVGVGFYRFGQPPKEQVTRALALRAIRQYFKQHRGLAADASLPLDAWLPAISASGEGVLLDLNEGQLRTWWRDLGALVEQHLNPAFAAFKLQLAEGFRSPVRNAEPAPIEDEFQLEWFARHTLVHTLSHVLMTQFAFDCGYSEESLAERLYVSVDPDAPMASVLIYTASGDSDGTLGGLSSLATFDRLQPAVLRALDRARFCSSDPICSERAGSESQVRAFNGVGCHCCVMTPDLSCESGNRMLDRALLVHPEFGYFRELLR